ncbi:hypothetical protein BDZ94DRAFT_1324344 [Collybia nuda]|uniref:FAD-binding PCMH-type domain-containing protein n=1 Tax=Collybia nuda TaxID=64659 RepID=A0A9P6CFB3_9AGAR|nr:hypothetical protein BDZ94DRAFT_1324344 [Collybia nuda]
MWLLCFFLVAFVSTLVSAANLRDSLGTAGITAVFPGDPKYVDASTAFNLRFDFKPAVITYPTTPRDVSEILKISSALNMKASARGGGHSYIANGLGGMDGVIVLDMRSFSKVTANPSQGTATIESGNRLGDIALALSKAGRGLPHGTCAYVGIGGHSSYGGYGFASRMWGLTLDTIQAVNMVLANGTTITASDKENSDLFWGMRGLGGSFGVTTSIEVKTFPAPPSATTFEYMWTLDVDAVARGFGAFEISRSDWFVEVELWGGSNSAVNAVPSDATAFAHRSSLLTIQFYASAPGMQPPFPDYGLTFLDNMVDSIISNSPTNWNYGAYPNYIDDRLPEWQTRYYGAHYPRLRALKDKYDPQDVFSFPTAVEE